MAKILIADDSRFQLTLLKEALEAKGFEVVTVKDGLQASMMALRLQLNAIILDLSMPGGSGLEVLKRLKRSMKTKSIPVLVLTANSDPGVRDTAISLGACDLISKPVDVEQLAATLSKLVTGSAARSTIAENPELRSLPDASEMSLQSAPKVSRSWREVLQAVAKEDHEV
jgi:CheY-like chemotaxis protein